MKTHSYAKANVTPANWMYCHVTLDGVAINYCIEADAVNGFVRHYKRDDAGRLIENATCDDLQEFISNGVVRILEAEL